MINIMIATTMMAIIAPAVWFTGAERLPLGEGSPPGTSGSSGSSGRPGTKVGASVARVFVVDEPAVVEMVELVVVEAVVVVVVVVEVKVVVASAVSVLGRVVVVAGARVVVVETVGEEVDS